MNDCSLILNKIPEEFKDVLRSYATNLPANYDYDTLVNSAYANFFSFYTPVKITSEVATDLEKFVLHYFILRRVGCGNRSKWVEMFRNKWRNIIPYYERILETTVNEANYIDDPITTSGYSRVGSNKGSANENSSETNRYLDTPQGNASHIWEINAQGQPVLNDTYLTDVRGITNSSSRTDKGSFNEKKTGYDGKSPSELLQEYRDTFLKTYTDIVTDLDEVFFNMVELDDFV